MPEGQLDWDRDDWPGKRSRQRDDDDEDEDYRPRKRTRRVRARSSGVPLLLGLFFGGTLLLLIAAVVVVATFLWKGEGPGGAPVANNPLGIPAVGLPAVGPPPVVRPPLPRGWVDFKHAECNLSIYCPQQPFPDEFYSHKPFGSPLAPGTAMVKGYETKPHQATKEKPLWCRVGVYEYPSSFSASAREVKLRGSFRNRPGASCRDVMWGGRPAVEGTVDEGGGAKSVIRHLWVGDRFYYAGLSGWEGHPTAAEQAAFFDSFVLGD